MDLEVNPIPIVCDMSTAPDTLPQRLAEYDRLFSTHLLGRERSRNSIRFRLRADEGVEAWVRDLAAREKACCAFLDSQIAVEGGQVLWDITTVDHDTAQAILDEYYDLPDSAGTDAVSGGCSPKARNSHHGLSGTGHERHTNRRFECGHRPVSVLDWSSSDASCNRCNDYRRVILS